MSNKFTRRRRLDDDGEDYQPNHRARDYQPLAAAQALFAPRPPRPGAAVAEATAAVTGKVKWFSHEKRFGFVALDRGGDAFIPGVLVGTDDMPTGAGLLVRVGDTPKGPAVTEIVSIDLSTARPATEKLARTLPAPTRTAIGTVETWRGTFGFVRSDANETIFFPGSVANSSRLNSSELLGARVEVGVAEMDRGPVGVTMKILDN